MLVATLAKVGQAVYRMLLIQSLRPDRLLAVTQQFVSSVMGTNFMLKAEQELNLANVIENEVTVTIVNVFNL